MLSKLIKHELRASRRIMLPFLGAVLALSVLAGISTTAMEHQVDYSWLNVVYGLIIFAFVMGVMAVCVVAVVMMIQRFYKNLLGDEGYVSFTLPATVDEHIFAKLISSFIWFFATAVVVVLSTFIMTATSLSAAFTEEGVVSINGMLNEVHFWEMFTGCTSRATCLRASYCCLCIPALCACTSTPPWPSATASMTIKDCCR